MHMLVNPDILVEKTNFDMGVDILIFLTVKIHKKKKKKPTKINC